MLTSWEVQDPKLFYVAQFEVTKTKARRVQREIDQLQSLDFCKDSEALKGGERMANVVSWTDLGGNVIELTVAGDVVTWTAAGGLLSAERCTHTVTKLTVARAPCPDQFTIGGPSGSSTIVHPPPGPGQVALVETLTAAARAAGVTVECDAVKKLEFLVAQMGVYANVMKILIAQSAKLDLDELQADLPEDKLAMRNKFYIEAARLLKTMEAAFDGAMAAPVSVFAWVCDEFKTIISEYPYESAHGFVVSMAAGAAYNGASVAVHGAGVPLAHFPHSVAVGGAAGFFAAAAILGLFSVAHWAIAAESEEAAGRRQLLRTIDGLREKELPLAELTEIRELFDRCFVTPVLCPQDGDCCIVCCEVLSSHASGDERPVRAPLCEARHFLHRRCHIQWMQTSQDMRCTVCRQ